jgi:hypothetical protein
MYAVRAKPSMKFVGEKKDGGLCPFSELKAVRVTARKNS